tara:strand:- start:1324 stop:1758 length:435 start_codon:yes stop_codon:yes gene_type:complete
MVECQCVLPQYKKSSNPVYHRFIVFSILEEDKVKVSFAQCNNCGVVHKVVDLCKSEILNGKENLNSLETIEDIKLSIPADLSTVLENYSCDISNWQHAKFIYENRKWGESIVLVREELESEIQGKFLTIVSHDRFKIETFLESL